MADSQAAHRLQEWGSVSSSATANEAIISGSMARLHRAVDESCVAKLVQDNAREMQRKKTKAEPAIVTEQIGLFLRHLREQKLGRSQEEAANDFGLENASSLSRIESGKVERPRFETIRRMYQTYGFSSWHDLVEAAGTFHETTDDQRPTVQVEVLPTADAIYKRLCEVIERVDQNQGVKDWFLGALHGVDERKRHPAEPEEECVPKREFDKLLREKCNSIGDKRWRVKMLMNLIRPERLEKLEGLLRATEHAIDFEVKFVLIERSLSMLSPCILGENDAFIGIQDPSYYRVESGIHLQGQNANRWLRRYWGIIWDQASWLRRATAIEADILKKLRN